jgi:membrane-associated phospholipid phosphatase
MRNVFGPSDVLSLLFLAMLSVLVVFSAGTVDSRCLLLVTYAVLAASVTAAAFYRRKTAEKRALYLSTIVTVLTILFVFNSLGDLIAGIQTRRFDDLLVRIDYRLFGVHPTVWMERFINPGLTAVLQFAYISYYFIPISLGITLIARGKQGEFEHALFGIVLCFYLSYIGYMLVPAVGPRFTLKELQTAGLQAGPFITGIQEFLNGLEHNKTDAFPSGHTAIALVSLYYAWKLREKLLFGLLFPMVLALIVSTVYLRYHYVIDVIAGIALAVLTIAIARISGRRFSVSSRQTGNERHHSS